MCLRNQRQISQPVGLTSLQRAFYSDIIMPVGSDMNLFYSKNCRLQSEKHFNSIWFLHSMEEINNECVISWVDNPNGNTYLLPTKIYVLASIIPRVTEEGLSYTCVLINIICTFNLHLQTLSVHLQSIQAHLFILRSADFIGKSTDMQISS